MQNKTNWKFDSNLISLVYTARKTVRLRTLPVRGLNQQSLAEHAGQNEVP